MSQGLGNGDKILRQFLINIFKKLISKIKTILYSKILLKTVHNLKLITLINDSWLLLRSSSFNKFCQGLTSLFSLGLTLYYHLILKMEKAEHVQLAGEQGQH